MGNFFVSICSLIQASFEPKYFEESGVCYHMLFVTEVTIPMGHRAMIHEVRALKRVYLVGGSVAGISIPT
jgi:hypothetical protein